MVDLSRLFLADPEQERTEESHPLAIRTLRESGGSTVVTIPPEVLDLVAMDVGDDVVIHATENSISLTRLDEATE